MNNVLIAYWACAGLGFLYIVGSAAMGHLHGSEDMDGGDAEGGDPGDVDMDVDADGGDPGDVDMEAGDANHHEAHKPIVIDHSAAGTVSKTRYVRSEGWYFKALSLLSPTKIAIFLFFFGAVGVILLAALPWLGWFSTLPALVLGYGIGRVLLNVLAKFVSGLHSSTNFKEDSLIGSQADLILSIEPGSLGEITVPTRGARHNAPARAKDPGIAIKTLSKVVICDRQNGVFIVEPISEEQ